MQLSPSFRQCLCPGPTGCLLTSLIGTPAWPAEAGHVLIQCIDPSGELFKFSQNLFVTLHCHGTIHRDAVKGFQLIAGGETRGFQPDDLLRLLHSTAELRLGPWVVLPREADAGGDRLLAGQQSAVDRGCVPGEGFFLFLAGAHAHVTAIESVTQINSFFLVFFGEVQGGIQGGGQGCCLSLRFSCRRDGGNRLGER